jgi:hypothetical protein
MVSLKWGIFIVVDNWDAHSSADDYLGLDIGRVRDPFLYRTFTL